MVSGCQVSCERDAKLQLEEGDPAERAAALSEAVRFIDRVESGDLKAAYEMTVEEWRSGTDLSSWTDQVGRLRKLYGRLGTRTPNNGGFLRNLPDGRPCNCFAFVFKAESGATVAGITVTVTKRTDRWRIGGIDVDATTTKKLL
jgi:hypothetical protein